MPERRSPADAEIAQEIPASSSREDRRRWMLALVVSVFAAPTCAGAQTRSRKPRIGVLSYPGTPSDADPDPRFAGFRQGLRELGYLEGENILVEVHDAKGQTAQLAGQAAGLVQSNVDLIVAFSPQARQAAKKVTSSIPIVTVSGNDPVQEGWAQSIPFPSFNMTGFTVVRPESIRKSFEFLKEACPGLIRVAQFYEPVGVGDAEMMQLNAGARRLGAVLGLEFQVLEVGGSKDFDAAFSLARQGEAQALFATSLSYRSRLAELALRDRLPSISVFPQMTQAGFLMSYGTDIFDLARRSARHVDKILKGAWPGNVPIEQPDRFKLSINLKTATALGISIPRSLLRRADEVIE
ncbi:ABC transporter substrate-binding protein [Variovorax sp. J2P1-59]|uniref:ABC transporter substrate-binding protein n=1 Tax=Variovorax flavidus TaxID=3053501 RepID=UPI0025754121|nr:ABC transporter substrate-binding protein [Variovorax sp. J2P1-59]MDM0076034.1 ABC transporter substrate-binding protein [Variovorax sp. J2P1-59]